MLTKDGSLITLAQILFIMFIAIYVHSCTLAWLKAKLTCNKRQSEWINTYRSSFHEERAGSSFAQSCWSSSHTSRQLISYPKLDLILFCEMVGLQCWWILMFRHPSFSFSCGSLPEGRDGIKYSVYSTLNRTKGNPTKASDTLN
jgi:hypothetical protein